MEALHTAHTFCNADPLCLRLLNIYITISTYFGAHCLSFCLTRMLPPQFSSLSRCCCRSPCLLQLTLIHFLLSLLRILLPSLCCFLCSYLIISFLPFSSLFFSYYSSLLFSCSYPYSHSLLPSPCSCILQS